MDGYCLIKSQGKTIREAWINAFDCRLEFYDDVVPAEKTEDGYMITLELHKPNKK